MDDTNIIKIGPSVRRGEESWDVKGRYEIVQIFISFGDGKINSIQFQYYDKNGAILLSKKHGGSTENSFDVVRLNYPSEYLTWVSGHTNIDDLLNKRSLTSLSFGTNKETYGPFGHRGKNDKGFRFGLGKEHQFFGFHGTTKDSCLASIGIYLKPSNPLGTSNVTAEPVKRGKCAPKGYFTSCF